MTDIKPHKLNVSERLERRRRNARRAYLRGLVRNSLPHGRNVKPAK